MIDSRDQGDEFATFFKREYRRIIGAVMRAGASFEDAEDAVNEAMRLAADRYHQLHAPGAWVRKVALRQFTGKRQLDHEREQREKLAANSEPAHLDHGDEYRLVRSILNGLPRVQRTVLALSMDGYSCQEIASMIGGSGETARSNLRHARRAMADGLSKAGWTTGYYLPRQAG